MSLDLLGEGFDLHAGGQDLRFPHHENERAQAVALGKTFANHWMHNGFVVDTEGEKMSKSLGNVSNLLDLIDVYDPRAYRMVLLQSHYRSPVKITSDSIGAAINSLAGLDSFAARTSGLAAETTSDPDVLAEFRAAMDDDLDTPRATALDLRHRPPGERGVRRRRSHRLRRWPLRCTRSATRSASNSGRRSTCPPTCSPRRPRSTRPAPARDFERADAIRAELQAAGWTVETTKDGTTIRR